MKHLRFTLEITLTDEDTGDVLCKNKTETVGNTQSVVHATKGIAQAVTFAFEIAGSTVYMQKQKEGEPLK
jgi:hypothetical protein